LRIGGLASGIDTDSIISNMMKANRIPLTKIVQKKQYLDWQVNDFRTVNRQLNDFSNMTWDKLLNPMTTGFRQKTVEISSPEDVSIKSLSSSGEFSGTLQIHQLAKNATMQSGEITGAMGNPDIPLANLEGSTMTINAVNKDGDMDEKTITVTSTDTLKSVLDRINKETGVNAFFDSSTGKIALSAKNSGAAGFTVQGDLAKGLGLTTDETAVVAALGGQDASFTLNGLDMTRSSNTFEVNGFEFTLKVANKTDITFSSAAAVDDIFDTVKNFVDEYNKMIEELNKKIREPKYRSYHPLSAEEKADMKENEIKLWEEKAMSGTLRNDPTITNMLTQMRSALMGAVGPAGEEGRPTLSSIGITTSKDYLDHGKLKIDEAALKKAISEDPSKVEEMFTKSSKNQEEQGFAVRLRSIVDASRKTVTNKAGNIGDANDTFTLGRTLKDMDKQIERFEERMKIVENRLWKQFTAMEQAINRANAQSAQLMNALGGGM
jgi:flagellar hook-associated protein 2